MEKEKFIPKTEVPRKEAEREKEEFEKKAIAEIPENLQRYIPTVKKFIESHKYVLATIARDPSLRYEPSVGETFEFHPKEGKIYLSAKQWEWAEKLGLNQEQILWSTLHEVAHFQDLVEDPEGMLGLFDYLEQKAREMTPSVLENWKKKFGGELPDYITKPVPVDPMRPEKKMNFVEIFLYQQYHMLYNRLDDIYVNRLVGVHSAPFAPQGSQAEKIKILYRDYLFPSKFEEVTHPLTGEKIKRPLIGQAPDKDEKYDLSSYPLAHQFIFSLLRQYMVPDQEIILANEVEEALKRQTDAIGKRSVVEEVKSISRPTSEYEPIQHTAGWRYKQIKHLIEPIFTELLLKDIDKLPPPPPPGPSRPPGREPEKEFEEPPKEEKEPEKPEGPEEGPEVIDPWQPPIKNPSPVDRKTIEDFIAYQKEKEEEERKKEEEERKARSLTPKERARKAQKDEDERFIREYFQEEGQEKIEEMLKVAEEYRKLEESIEPYIKDLAQVFDQIMQNVSQQVSLAWEEGWRSGRFNIDRFIRKYAAYLQEGAPPLSFDQLDVYDQREFFERLRLFPEKIKVRLVLDGSGSMNEERLLALKQNAILIMEALSAFEFTVNLRFRLKEPIHIDTEIRMFGSPGESRIIKPFAETKNYNPEEARADRLKAFPFIHNNYGGTCDAEPWWKIDASLDDPKYLEELKKGKAKEFIFEVTDGGSNESTHDKVPPAQDTRDAIDAVEKKGVIGRGFQIGTPTEKEKKIFDQIWGENGSRIKHPSKLAPAMTKTLAEEIRKAQFKIQYEEGEEG